MDVVAVHKAMEEARRIIRDTGGPVVIEALCYRHFHSSGSRAGRDFARFTETRDELEAIRAALT